MALEGAQVVMAKREVVAEVQRAFCKLRSHQLALPAGHLFVGLALDVLYHGLELFMKSGSVNHGGWLFGWSC